MNINSRYFIISCLALIIATPLIGQPTFIDRGIEFGLVESYSDLPLFGGGLSVRDFDGDGWDDVTMCTGAGRPIKFYKNQFGQGFQEVSPIPTPPESQFFSCWIDFDGDNDLDFFIVTLNNGVRLYSNDGNMNYSDITNISGLSNLGGVARQGCAFGDFNNDGLIDLYLPQSGYAEENKMFFQDINNVFQDVSIISNTGDSLKATFQGVLIDYNQDGWIDLYLANDLYDGNTLFRNNGDSTFTDVSVETGAYQELDAMGLAVGDFDNDLDLDIHVTDKIDSKLLELTALGTFNEVGTQRGVDFSLGFGWGNNFFDADLDGDEDLYVSGSYFPIGASEPSVMYVNDGFGYFTGTLIGADSAYSFTNAIGDFNNDRKTDIAVLNSNGDPMKLWVNETNVNASRFTLGLEGCQSNIEAAGSKVIAFDGADSRLYSYHVSQSFLGQNSDKKIIPILNGSVLDSLRILWPSGGITTLHEIEPDQTLMVNECSTPAPVPVVMVPNYSTQGLVLCSGDSILLAVNGDYPSVTWSNGETSDSIYVTAAGNYSVSVVNQYGNSASSSSVTIIEREYPSYSLSFQLASCYDDGLIDVIPADSGSMYTYDWSNGSSESHLTGLIPGSYYVTITDQGECATFDSVLIDGPSNFLPLNFNALFSNPLCFGDGSGVISLLPSGGSVPYTYLWSNNSSDSTQSLPAGNYKVTITDFYGCDKDTSISLSQPSQILSYIDVIPDTSLTGLGIISLDVFGGTPPYVIEWSDAQNQTGSIAQNLIAGDYSAQITDANLCTRTLEIKVPNIDLTGTTEIQNEACGLMCRNQSSSILVELAESCGQSTSLNALHVYNMQGQQINFMSRQISSTKTEIVLDKLGVFLILESTGKTCKILKMSHL